MHINKKIFEVSAYIIFFNNQDTITKAVDSLLNQTIPLKKILLIDDCSTDRSYELVSEYNVELVKNKKNMGRGYSRNLAHKLLKSSFVLSLDATNTIPTNFIEKSIHWFSDRQVGAIYGRITQQKIKTLSDSWRGIHLFNDDIPQEININHTFISYGSIVRKKSYELTSGYNKYLTHNEDVDLGESMIKSGFKIIFDPSLIVISSSHSGVFKTLERYARWNSGFKERPSLRNYIKNILFSLKCMCLRDFKSKRYSCILVSLICPHFHFLYQLKKYLK